MSRLGPLEPLRPSNIRQRPQPERNALGLLYFATIFVVLGVVIVVLTPKNAYVGYACFGVAVVELLWSAVLWSRRDR